MDIMSLIASIAAGSITGYITNTIAVDMLFRGIGPFSGVIIKTRNEFTRNISKLVERDIVNHRTIEKELSKDEFKGVLDKLLSDIFNSEIYNHIEDTKLEDVEGLDKTKENIKSYYGERAREYIDEMLVLAIDRLEVSDIVSDKQVKFISETLVDTIIRLLDSTNILERALFRSYREFRYMTISDFVTEDLYSKLSENIINLTKDLHKYLEENRKTDIEDMVKSLYADAGISDILRNIEEDIKEKTLGQLIGKDRVEKLVYELKRIAVEFLESKDTRPVIDNFILELLGIAESIDIYVSDILASDLASNLEDIVEEKLALLIEDILLWIDENKEEIEDLLERAIQSELNKNYDNRFKDKLKKGLYQIFYDGEFARRFDLVEKIVGSIENNADKSVLSRELTGELIGFAKKNRLGDIFKLMKDTGAIDVKDISLFMTSSACRYLDRYNFKLTKEISDLRLGGLLDFDLVDYFESEKKQGLIEWLTSKYLYSKKTTDWVQDKIIVGVDRAYRLKLEQILGSIDPKTESKSIKKRLVASIYENKGWTIGKLYRTLLGASLSKPLSKISNGGIRSKLSNRLLKNSVDYMESKFIDIKKNSLEYVYRKINHSIDIPKKLSAILPIFIHKNLEDMLEGRVSDLISENLEGFSDRDIQYMVEDFMGKELKPITRFGALLGGISGIILYFTQLNMGLSGLSSNILSFMAYGLVGYLTNFIALKMIFRPYKQKKLLGIPIPLTPGIVSKEKPRFARSMGKFVEDDLLNPQKVDEILGERQEQIKRHILEMISRENYTLLDDLIRKNMDLLVDEIVNYGQGKINRDAESLVYGFISKMEKVNLGELEITYLEASLKVKLKQVPKIYRKQALDFLEDKLSRDKSISSIWPRGLSQSINSKIYQILGSYLERLRNFLSSSDSLANHIGKNSRWFDEISNKNIGELLSDPNRDGFKYQVKKELSKLIYSDKSKHILAMTVEERILDQVGADDKIGQLFDGKVSKLIHENARPITDLILKRANIVFENEKETIKQQTILLAKEKTKGYSLLNWLLDIDSSIENIIDNLIDQEIPGFLKSHRDEYSGIMDRGISNIEDISVGELGLKLDSIVIRDLVDQVYMNEAFIRSTDLLLDKSIVGISSLNIGRVLKMVSVESIGDLLSIFDPQIQAIRDHILDLILSQGDDLRKSILKEIDTTIDDLLDQIKLADLFKYIDRDMLEPTLYGLLDQLLASKAYEPGLDQFIEKAGEDLRDRKLEDIISLSSLKADMVATIHKLVDDDILALEIKSMAKNILVELLDKDDLVEIETKDFISEITVDTIISAIGDNLFDIIESLNLGDVTEEQINDMGIEEIEKLFDSFAKGYFRKLEAYGFIGSIFGIAYGAAGILVTLIWKLNRIYSDRHKT